MLQRRPRGWVEEADFALREVPVATPGEGDVLVRNVYLSLDPYMRGRMNAGKSYAAPFALDEVLQGRVIGEVAASRHPGFKPGEVVFGMLGWEDYSLSRDAEGLRHVDPAIAPLPYHLGILGMPGMTAWYGMLEIGRPEPGETVYVSAAAGAVGQIAGQIAGRAGARVVGSAGDDAKVAYLVETLGFDAAFNYKTVPSYLEALRRHCPDGIDVYFDNVGGAMLEAALEQANERARFVECGMVSQYNLERPEGVRNLTHVNRKRLTLQGFIISDHAHHLQDFLAEMSGWLAAGEIRYRVDVADGLEQAPAAFIGMLRGRNFGKQVVRIGPEPG